MRKLNIELNSKKFFWLIFIVAALSFLVTLSLPLIGEEEVFTTGSFEMWFHHDYLHTLLFGVNSGRPPLFNWLIILFVKIFGWNSRLIIARTISAFATIGCGLILYWLAKNLFKDERFAIFTAVAYLTTDALMYHGWIAYADPLFALGVFASLACLWVASEKENFWLLLGAVFALTLAFLTKALTAYFFYGITFFILCWKGEHRRFLLNPKSIVLHILACFAPMIWTLLSDQSNAMRIIFDLFNFNSSEVGVHQNQLFASFGAQINFLLQIFLRIAPVSIFAVYLKFRKQITDREIFPTVMKLLLFIVVINFLPYWLLNRHESRYILPLYPLMALIAARYVWRSGEKGIRLMSYLFIVVVIIKYILSFWLLPYYQHNYRGNYPEIAAEIIKITKTSPIYLDSNVGAYQQSVVDYIDVQNYPNKPVETIAIRPKNVTKYFLISPDKNESSGKVVREFNLGKSDDKVYLIKNS